MATRQDLCMRQGETFIFSFDPIVDAAGVVVDLSTGYVAKIQFRENVADVADAVLSDVTNIVLGADGIITIRIESAETYTFSWLSGVYDIALAGPVSGTRPYFGAITIIETVTR